MTQQAWSGRWGKLLTDENFRDRFFTNPEIASWEHGGEPRARLPGARPGRAELMALGEHSPDLWADSERMRQDLKHDESVRGAIARAAQCREGQGVRGVVGEIEAAFQRIRLFLGVGESSEAGPLEPGYLLRVRGLLAQRLPRPAEILKRRGHARRR